MAQKIKLNYFLNVFLFIHFQHKYGTFIANSGVKFDAEFFETIFDPFRAEPQQIMNEIGKMDNHGKSKKFKCT